MCVNDIITCGAKPLIFLDYIACGKVVPEKVAAIVSGVAEGCVQAGAALVGGGERPKCRVFTRKTNMTLRALPLALWKIEIIDNTQMRPGDAIIALPSSGVHSNGFSLVRRVFGINEKNGVAL